jgi:hypothetical protein
MARGRLFTRAQAEVIAVYVLALLLVLMVGIAIRFYVMSGQLLKQVEERKREVQQTVLSGGVRGYVSGDTVYLASGIPLLVYSVMIHNGSHILWINPKPPSGLTSYRTAMPVMEVSSLYVPIYSGSLTALVEQCRARVVLATDKGLIKWCPSVVTKYINNTIESLLTPMTPVGSFRIYYVGNISFFGLYGILSNSIESSRTVLYPLAVLYTDPLRVSEKWSSYVVNVTIANTVTGDTAWVAFDVSQGAVVSRRIPAARGNDYVMFLAAPSQGLSSVASLKPVSLGGVDVFIFTAYYLKPSGSSGRIYASELLTGAQLYVASGDFVNYIATGTTMQTTCRGVQYLASYGVSTKSFGDIYVGILYPSTLVGSFAIFKQLSINTWTSIYYSIATDYRIFDSTGSFNTQMSYAVHSSIMSSPSTGTATSWSICREGNNPGTWFYVKARSAVKIPSGRTIEVGLNITVQVSTGAQPPAPPTTTPSPPPIAAQWFVHQSPIPTNTTPINTKITVFTTQPINTSQYKIHYLIINLATNQNDEGYVNPTYLQSYGWGYQFVLDADAPRKITIEVQYFDKTKNDYVTVFRWSGGNYLGAA